MVGSATVANAWKGCRGRQAGWTVGGGARAAGGVAGV